MKSELLRQLPGVDQLLQTSVASGLIAAYGRPATLTAVRWSLDQARDAILAGHDTAPATEVLLSAAGEHLAFLTAPTLRPVINATGVIIHTNLGRSPLSQAALGAMVEAAQHYSTLEYDPESGRRGSRSVHAHQLLTRLIGSEEATVVNNNAAAVLLTLTALAQGREVIISRGQLVEIGGSFRIPDVMAQSGATLVEVGATNRTHLHDYQAAITERTAAIMVAHHSNFRMLGFTAEPELAELCALAHQNGILFLHDLGSGTLLDTADYGLAHEPTVQESLTAGTDVASFSGDKLLGGPQAGIIVGRRELITRIKTHPLARAVRPDKLCLAGLSATLLHYLKDEASRQIPIWLMIAATPEEIKRQARRWARHLAQNGLTADITPGESTIGGGSLPGETLPTWLVVVRHPRLDAFAARLRSSDPPLIGRIAEDRLLLDPRTVLPDQSELLLQLLLRAAEAV